MSSVTSVRFQAHADDPHAGIEHAHVRGYVCAHARDHARDGDDDGGHGHDRGCDNDGPALSPVFQSAKPRTKAVTEGAILHIRARR